MRFILDKLDFVFLPKLTQVENMIKYMYTVKKLGLKSRVFLKLYYTMFDIFNFSTEFN